MILKCISCNNDLTVSKDNQYFYCDDSIKCSTVCEWRKDGSFLILYLLHDNIIYNIEYDPYTNEIAIDQEGNKFKFKAHLDFKKESIINLLDNLIFM